MKPLIPYNAFSFEEIKHLIGSLETDVMAAEACDQSHEIEDRLLARFQKLMVEKHLWTMAKKSAAASRMAPDTIENTAGHA
jgi:hypothetical protein